MRSCDIDCNMISFSFLPKDGAGDILPKLFDILHENMKKIAPTGQTYEEDLDEWIGAVAPALEKKPRQIILITDDDETVGFFQYYVNDKTFMMEEIQLLPEYQGKGIFQKLYAHLVEIVPGNIPFVEAYAHKNNLKSQGILKHLGLEIIGENKNGNSYHYRGGCRKIFEKYGNYFNIKPVEVRDIPECVAVIRNSFKTVADEFGFTEENAPRFTAFAMNEDRLLYHLNVEMRPMFKYVEGGRIIGYYSLHINDSECELNNLCVLPEFRHRGLGKELLEDAFKKSKEAGCAVVKIGIVEENMLLKKWYESFGFKHTGCVKYDFFPFTCGFMEREL